MGKKDTDLIFAVGIFIALAFFVYRYHGDFGIDVSVGTNMFTLIPSVLAVLAAVFVIGSGGSAAKFGGSVGVGISLAYMAYQLNGLGLLVGALAGLTLAQIQIIVIILSTIIGAILYAAS